MEEIAKENGYFGLFRLIAGLAIRIPIEYLSEMRQDLVYAVRTLKKARGFAAVGIISQGLGMGVAGIAVSEALNLILRDAPGVRDADRVVMVNGVSYPYIEHYRDEHGLFAGAAAFQLAGPCTSVALNDRIVSLMADRHDGTAEIYSGGGRQLRPSSGKSRTRSFAGLRTNPPSQLAASYSSMAV